MGTRSLSSGTLLAALLMVVAGCRAPSRSELVGTYKLRYPFGTEELRLHDDGTYLQVVRLDRGGLSAANSGKWEYKEKAAEVSLIDPLLVDDNTGKVSSTWRTPQSGLWGLEAEKWPTGRITLYYSPDFDYRFKKIE